MTVKELINKLNEVENKDLPIFIYNENDIYNFEVDDNLIDRVDLNLLDQFRFNYSREINNENN